MYALPFLSHTQNVSKTNYQEDAVTRRKGDGSRDPSQVRSTHSLTPEDCSTSGTPADNFSPSPLQQSSKGQETKNKQQKTVTNCHKKQKSRLNDKHYNECVTKRGLNPEWIEINCRSMTTKEASERLGYPAKCPGIWLEGTSGFGQFRPNKPWKKKDEDKAAKYRSAKNEEYDAMMPRNPHDPNYWNNLVELEQLCWKMNGHPCLAITEGLFKAIAACDNNIPCVALAGVEMGLTPAKNDVQGKRYLVETLERFARAGFGFIIIFDADAATNDNVVKAQGKLAAQLLKFKVPVYIATGLWDIDQGKGMDDYIQNNGADKFKKEVLARAMAIEQWEQQFKNSIENKPSKVPPEDIIARQIIEKYGSHWRWNNEHKSWMIYEHSQTGIWEAVDDFYIEVAIQQIITARGIEGYGKDSYITNIRKFIARLVPEYQWKQRENILPFLDGVVDLKTGKFEKHSPVNKLTWCLPRRYKTPESDNWDSIRNWLHEATQGDLIAQRILLCFAAAVIRGRADLQIFLYLIGDGGCGKGTYQRLLEAVLGKENTWSGSIDGLEDKNEVARLVGKRLAIFPDQEKAKKVKNFKNLTGQDGMVAKRLYKDGFNFVFEGLPLVTANKPVLFGAGSWFKRRARVVNFYHEPTIVKDLDKIFDPEIAAFTKYLISITDEEIDEVLRHNRFSGITRELWTVSCRQDTIASWIEECIVFDPNAFTQTGRDKNQWLNHEYDPKVSTLFGSYHHYCRAAGLQPRGLTNFTPDFEEMCNKVLQQEVKRHRNRTGIRGFKGLRLRLPHEPFFSEVLFKDDDGVNYDSYDKGDKKLEPLQIKDDDRVDDSYDKVDDKGDDKLEPLQIKVDDNDDNLLKEINCAEVDLLPVGANESQNSQTIEEPCHHCHQESQNTDTVGVEGDDNLDDNQASSSQAYEVITKLWNDENQLGEYVLSLSDETIAVISPKLNPEQKNYITTAANKVWRLGFGRDAMHCGERVEIWEAGQGRDIKVSRKGSTQTFKVKRGNLLPWLGW